MHNARLKRLYRANVDAIEDCTSNSRTRKGPKPAFRPAEVFDPALARPGLCATSTVRRSRDPTTDMIAATPPAVKRTTVLLISRPDHVRGWHAASTTSPTYGMHHGHRASLPTPCPTFRLLPACPVMPGPAQTLLLRAASPTQSGQPDRGWLADGRLIANLQFVFTTIHVLPLPRTLRSYYF